MGLGDLLHPRGEQRQRLLLGLAAGLLQLGALALERVRGEAGDTQGRAQ